jgi:YEATS domain-containing protein 4
MANRERLEGAELMVDTHKWTVFLTSATSPPPSSDEDEMNYLPGGLDDLSYLLKKVTFRLHETYSNPNRGECAN